MHPAPSVILFTVLSGAGFGLLALVALGLGAPSSLPQIAALPVGGVLAAAGLIASTFHLGHPERAWRAFSQWRTSWLSREGCISVAALLAATALFGATWTGWPSLWLAPLAGLLALATVFCTAMIYAQLGTVPRWHDWTTPALFLGFSVTGGAILACPGWAAGLAALALGGLMAFAFRRGDGQFARAGQTLGKATGLAGQVRVFAPPHTSPNYLMKEMIHQVGRKHARKLRRIALVCAALLPAALMILLPPSLPLAALAFLIHLTGAFAQRWLFFAEAEHVVGLYYGAR